MVQLDHDGARVGAGVERQEVVAQRAAHDQVGLARVQRVGLHLEDIDDCRRTDGDAAAVLIDDGHGYGVRAGLFENVVDRNAARAVHG